MYPIYQQVLKPSEMLLASLFHHIKTPKMPLTKEQIFFSVLEYEATNNGPLDLYVSIAPLGVYTTRIGHIRSI